jgi:hypothetical protein
MLNPNAKEWGEIEVDKTLNVIGRGLVLVTSIDADPGDLVMWKGVTYRIKDVEFMRNGMGDGGFKKSGLIVVVGEAGSSSTLDATEAGEARKGKSDGKE